MQDQHMQESPEAAELFAQDLKSLEVDPLPDVLMGRAGLSTFSCVGSASTATCAATLGSLGTASSL
jgi:hypothetical protein